PARSGISTLSLHDALPILERPEPEAAINDVVVQIHASGFVPTELDWPSTWPIADGNKDTIDPRARVGRSRHRPRLWHDGSVGGRSEEHTSELQSPCNLVCR